MGILYHGLFEFWSPWLYRPSKKMGAGLVGLFIIILNSLYFSTIYGSPFVIIAWYFTLWCRGRNTEMFLYLKNHKGTWKCLRSWGLDLFGVTSIVVCQVSLKGSPGNGMAHCRVLNQEDTLSHALNSCDGYFVTYGKKGLWLQEYCSSGSLFKLAM